MALYESRLSNRSEVTNNNNNNNNNNVNANASNANNNSNNQISCDNSYIMPVTVTTTNNESYGNIGGPTQTTSTLTPTTLKNIEESFMEIIPRQPVTHQHMAGFVPPLVNITSTYATLVNNSNSSNNSNSNSDLDYISDEETEDSSSQSQWSAVMEKTSLNGNNKSDAKSSKVNGTKTRGTSGRKPMRNDKLTPEEERKREQRRERNKQAAARCRKRRMDHTNSLLRETDGLEEKRQALHNEIEHLKQQKEELEYILETHKSNCKLSTKAEQIDIKPVVSNGNIIMNSNSIKARPNSLPISCGYSNAMSESHGIPIQTPSNGLYLESMEGGTGLTPILNSITPASITPGTLLSTPTTISSSNCNKSLTTPNVDCSEGPIKLVPL